MTQTEACRARVPYTTTKHKGAKETSKRHELMKLNPKKNKDSHVSLKSLAGKLAGLICCIANNDKVLHTQKKTAKSQTKVLKIKKIHNHVKTAEVLKLQSLRKRFLFANRQFELNNIYSWKNTKKLGGGVGGKSNA